MEQKFGRSFGSTFQQALINFEYFCGHEVGMVRRCTQNTLISIISFRCSEQATDYTKLQRNSDSNHAAQQ